MKRLVKYCFMAALGLLIPGILLCVLGTPTAYGARPSAATM